MSAPLTIKFATDTSAAKSGMQDLAASVLSNMVKVSDSLNTGIKANGGYAATVKTLATSVGSDFLSVANAGLKAANDTNLSGVAIGAAVGKAAAETKTASVVMKGGFAVASAQAQFAYSVIRNEAAATANLLARSPLVIGGVASLAVAAASYLFVKAAVEQANAQLDRFIKLGDNASQAGVSVDFWQRFSEAALKAKMDVEAVEQALKTASTAVTPKFEQEDPIKKRLNEVFESGYLGSYQSKGLADYNAASSNEGRIRAAVTAMQELRDLGVQLAAIDLAEKLFGAETAARIRSGKLDIDQIAKSLDAPRDDLVKQEEVERANEFRERLEAAYKTIDEFLHVSVALEGSGRAVLDAWLGIAEAVAKATTNAGSFYTKLQEMQGPLGDYLAKVGAILGGTAKIFAEGFGDQANGTRTIYNAPIGPGLPGMPGQQPAPPALTGNRIENAPQPPRKPLSFYIDPGTDKASKGGGSNSESFDAVETLINGLEKSAAAAKAEAEAFGKSNTEKAQAIALARLKETADQQGITVTDEQIAKVKAATAASAKYKDQIADLEQQQQQAAETARYFGNAISSSFADAILEGKSFSSILQDLEKQIARAALQAAFTGQGPLAGILGLAPAASSGSNAVGGLAGAVASLFGGGARANGGPVQAGRGYKVGEMGEEMFVPDQDGRIVPISRGGFGSAGGAPINVYNYAGEAVSATPQRRSDGGVDLLIDRVDSGLAQRVGSGRGDLASLSPGSRNLRG